MRVSLCPVPVSGLCGPGMTCFPVGMPPGPADRCICPGCPCHRATCVMTVSISTLLAGRYGCNCLYLSWLRNKSLAKRSFRKVVLADSCRGFNLATPSISVSYRECVPNRACQEGRKLGFSLIGFRKFCAFPCHMVMHVCLWQTPLWNACSATRDDRLTMSGALQ